MTPDMNYEAISCDAGISTDGVAVLTFLTSNQENLCISMRREELEALLYGIDLELKRVISPQTRCEA